MRKQDNVKQPQAAKDNPTPGIKSIEITDVKPGQVFYIVNSRWDFKDDVKEVIYNFTNE